VLRVHGDADYFSDNRVAINLADRIPIGLAERVSVIFADVVAERDANDYAVDGALALADVFTDRTADGAPVPDAIVLGVRGPAHVRGGIVPCDGWRVLRGRLLVHPARRHILCLVLRSLLRVLLGKAVARADADTHQFPDASSNAFAVAGPVFDAKRSVNTRAYGPSDGSAECVAECVADTVPVVSAVTGPVFVAECGTHGFAYGSSNGGAECVAECVADAVPVVSSVTGPVFVADTVSVVSADTGSVFDAKCAANARAYGSSDSSAECVADAASVVFTVTNSIGNAHAHTDHFSNVNADVRADVRADYTHLHDGAHV
jgi:hypothetical protein